MDVAAWRTVGLELGFDPEAAQPAVRELLSHVDAERLLRYFPREPDRRYGLDELVVLAEVARPPRGKPHVLCATAPARRSAPQVITIGIHCVTPRNFRHRWDVARWLWDRRAADTPELDRWGTRALDLDALRAGRAPAGESPDAIAARAILLARDGNWREALASCGVAHLLDELPYDRGNHGAGVEPAKWDTTLDAQLRDIAPWRFDAALERMERSQREWRLFNLPGQTTARKYGVALRRRDGKPELFLHVSGSNTRTPDVYWRWPPDLAAIVRGETVEVRPAVASHKTSMETGLLAQVAAHPDDHELKRIYADMLIERDDPRGEFIELQLRDKRDRAATTRMNQLEKKHARTWLGPLGRLVEGMVFERGFLVRCRLGGARTPFDAWQTALDHGAELAMLRELELPDNVPVELARELLGPGRLPSLQVISIPLALVTHVRRRLASVELRLAGLPDLAGANLAIDPRPAELAFALPHPSAFVMLAQTVFPRDFADRVVLRAPKLVVRAERGVVHIDATPAAQRYVANIVNVCQRLKLRLG